MNSQDHQLRVVLETGPEQHQRLQALQQVFASASNVLAPIVQQTRCWNRVGLHHLAYHRLRELFPTMGSQMACNAIYSVCRIARIAYQHPDSPFNLQRRGAQPLPLLQFTPQSPVYFDRHTLSLRDGVASLFTLEGRMRFDLVLEADDEQRFRHCKLRELALSQQDGRFSLNFLFGEGSAADQEQGHAPNPSGGGEATPHAAATPAADWPDYVLVQDGSQADPQPLMAASQGPRPGGKANPPSTLA